MAEPFPHLQKILCEHFAGDADLRELDGDLAAGVGDRSLHEPDQSAAAGDFHVHHMDEFHLVHLNDVGEFFPIEGGIIEFGAADQSDFSLQEAAVEIRESEGRADRRDQ